MGSLNPDAGPKQELDDSGYVQDETKQATEETKTEEYTGTAELLDLSDDVLLYILQNLSPQDLKALGFTCARLGALVLDRTLWVDVDAGGAPLGRRRVRWLLARALGPHTRRLCLRGYADQAEGCLGYVNRYNYSANNEASASGSTPPEEERYLCGGPRVYRLTQTFPNRYGGAGGRALSPAPDGCCGPRLTLTHTALRELGATCSTLRTLELEHCVIDCQTTNIGMFPKTLTKLSLRGTKCFNLESKSFLFKIQDHLSHLEELDVSYCSWIEPACMLPLSKMPCLHTLSMRECLKLAEFVAYASLATRYGFKKLKKLDLSGSPVGDSEVSALGWLPRLRELRLAPAPRAPRASEHAHYSQDLLPAHNELEEWEEAEPEYFRPPPISEDEWMRDEDDVHGNRSRYYTTNCEDPSACILLERMIAEPVAPEEYSQVYHQFLAGHNNNVPLANPEEYRQAYRQFMFRPTHGHPPAGYSLFIRKPEDRNEAGPSKRRRTEQRPCRSNEAKPGTSTEDNATPSTSSEQPSSSSASHPTGSPADQPADEPTDQPTDRPTDRPTRKRDSDDSADRGPPSKRHNHSPKKSKKKRSRGRSDDGNRQPRRVFEITINELNARLQAFNGGANNEANVPNNVVARNVAIIANIEVNVANNVANIANIGLNVANNQAIVANNEANVANNVANIGSIEVNLSRNVANVASNEANVANNVANVATNEVNAISNEANIANNRDVNEVNTGTNNKSNGNDKNEDNKSIVDCKPAGNSEVASGSGSDRGNSAGSASANDQFAGNSTDNDTCSLIEANTNTIADISLPSSGCSANINGACAEPDLNISYSTNTAGNSSAVANTAGDNAADANTAGNIPVVVIPAGNAVADANGADNGPIIDIVLGDASDNFTADANAAGNGPVVAIVAGNGPDVDISPGNSSDKAAADANAAGNGPVVAIIAGNAVADANVAGNGPVVDIGPGDASGNATADVNAAGNGPVVAIVAGNAVVNANPAGNGPVVAIVAGDADGNVPVVAIAAGNPAADANAAGNANAAPARQRIFQFRQYRRPIVIEEFINVGDPEAPGVLPRGVMFPGCTTRLDPTALVSDASIRRFGRAIGENINYIHIGGGAGDANARPDRSSLTFLSVTGFRHVTDASLLHLATAAPLLQRLDVSGTAVTAGAVERFKALRPDVEVIADHVADKK